MKVHLILDFKLLMLCAAEFLLSIYGPDIDRQCQIQTKCQTYKKCPRKVMTLISLLLLKLFLINKVARYFYFYIYTYGITLFILSIILIALYISITSFIVCMSHHFKIVWTNFSLVSMIDDIKALY